MDEVIPFLHPALGGLSLLAMMSLGARGLQARQGVKGAHKKRKRHAKQGPWIAGAMTMAALTGLGTVVFVRDDLDPVGSWHFWAGWFVTLCMLLLAYMTPRRFRRNQLVKSLHPAVGVVVMITGVVVLLVGIELLP